MKLVVWDLDDTIWKGTYMYDGKNIQLNTAKHHMVGALDDIGLLQSIISRNSPEVWDIVDGLGLSAYFILPKINWESKPLNMEKLLNEVHILPKDVAFVDDDPRNLEEMKRNFPEIDCRSPDNISDFIKIATPSGSNEERKKFFNAEAKRLALGDDFVKMLDLELTVKRPTGTNELDRVLELINRSNQLHATGHRFNNVDELASKYELFLGYPKDKYGEYGLSLIAAIQDNERDIVVREFIVSCRVMERGLVAPFLRAIQDNLKKKIVMVCYEPTEYNKPIYDILNSINGSDGGQIAVPLIAYYGKIQTTGDVRVKIV